MIRDNNPKLEVFPMRFKKIFAFSFVFSALLGIAFATAGSKKSGVVKAVEPSGNPDFSGETLVGDDLSVSLMAASTTGYSTAYDIKFSTGGDAFYDTENMVNVLGNDDSLMDFYVNEFSPLTTEEKSQWRRDVREGRKDTLYYEGYIHSFEMNNSKVYVPRTLSRGEYQYDAVFTVNITSIASNAFGSNARVTDLYIPKEIEYIPADAFTAAPELEHIYCEATTAPAGFEAGWDAGKAVEWGIDIYAGDANKYENTSTIATREVGDPTINYILGYYPELGDQYPLTLEYELMQGQSSLGIKYVEFNKISKLKDYDGVGKGIASYSTLLTFVIEHEKNQSVNYESLRLHNIFYALSSMHEGKQVWEPDFSRRYYSLTHRVYDIENDLNDFIKINFERVTTFNGYTSVNTKIDVVKKGLVYKTLKPNFYQKYEKDLKSGAARLRFRFTGLMNANYHVYYGNKDRHLSIETPIGQYILKGYEDNNFTVTLKNSSVKSDFTAEDLKALSLNNISISIDIVKNDVILTKTAVTVSFGAIYLMRGQALNEFNLNVFFLVFTIGYLVAAAAASTALFIYFKRKYKNDEFRRLKPKQFIKKAIIYSLTSLVVVLFVLFVVMRLTCFHNSIVVYNPLDVFVIINGIATIIIIGYYIKNLVGFIKANKQRKRALRLGLQNDEADDGTK